MVDFKLAFQRKEKSLPDHNAPSRTGLVRASPHLQYRDRYEFFKTNKISCGQPWCFDPSCQSDPFYKALDLQVENIAAKVDKQLAKYQHRNKVHSDTLSEFKRHMEDEDLIILLPGMVSAFALRSRKWGRLPSCSSCFVQCD